jgi:kynurenine formamidase
MEMEKQMALKFYDLSQPFGANTPCWPWPVMTDTEIYRVSFPERDRFPGGVNKLTTVIKTKFHISTHMDAPIHVLQGGLTIDQIPLSSCYGEGVIVDMRHKKKWDIITPKDLEEANPQIKEGDFVVINTGWHKYFKDNSYDFFNYYPGLYKEAAEWLVDHKIKALAVDGGATDTALAHRPLDKYAPWLYTEYKEVTGKDANEEFPIYEPCHYALAKAGIPGIECAGGQIDEVTGKRCTIAAFPFKYVGGDAAFVRLVAIVDE